MILWVDLSCSCHNVLAVVDVKYFHLVLRICWTNATNAKSQSRTRYAWAPSLECMLSRGGDVEVEGCISVLLVGFEAGYKIMAHVN